MRSLDEGFRRNTGFLPKSLKGFQNFQNSRVSLFTIRQKQKSFHSLVHLW